MATTTSMIGPFAARLAAAAALLLAGLPALAQSYVETPLFAERVGKGELPPVAQRLPKEPLVVDLAAKGRSIGQARRRGDVARRPRARTSATCRSSPTPGSSATRKSSRSSRTFWRSSRTTTTRPSPSAPRRPSLVGRPSVHDRGLPLLLGGRGAQPRALAGRHPRVHDAGRQAAPLRDPRRAHGPIQLGQAEPALPAAARRAARPGPVPAGPLPEAVPRQIRRQGKARGSREEAEAQVLGGAAQPHGRHVREHQSGPADPAGLAGDECRPGDPLHLRAQPLLPPRRRDRSAAALYRPRRSSTSRPAASWPRRRTPARPTSCPAGSR